ncbi:MAG: VCBS repeat-containing protein, partial [Gammaproteobacteria bacterium]|nr:VCBS repeat-containing protein [Gammaproteobacteria bacterium]
MLLRKKLDLTFSYLKSVIANPAVLVATIFLLHQIHSFAATPGLPFTEDFTDSSLKDPATIANWSTRLGRIEQAQRKATSVGFGPLRTIASDVSLYSKDTRSIHLADVNSDGYLDAIAGAVDGAIYISLSNGTNIPFSNNNTMVVNAGAWVTDIDSGDVDQDGDIDIVLAGFGLNVVLLNNGTDIPFSVSSAISTDADDTYAIKLADVNGDGWLDVVAGNSGASNKLYLNNKTSTPFSGVVGQNISNSIQNTYDIDTADIDNDGDMD